MTTLEAIQEASAESLASIFEAAFARLGELGREGGIAVRERIAASEAWEVEEGVAQLDDLYA